MQALSIGTKEASFDEIMYYHLLHLRAIPDCTTGTGDKQEAVFTSQDFKTFPWNAIVEVEETNHRGDKDPFLVTKGLSPHLWYTSEVQV